MKTQEILEEITKHRANQLVVDPDRPAEVSIKQKIEEIEWTLQAITEVLSNGHDTTAKTKKKR